MFEIINMANFLGIRPIVNGCEDFMRKKMNPSNCISIWTKSRSESIVHIAFKYIVENFETVLF